MRRLSALLPLVIVALGACELGIDEGPGGSGLIGGQAPDDTEHCSGLMEGAHCKLPDNGNQSLEPGELLPLGIPCDFTDPMDFTCLALGMECVWIGPQAKDGECGITGLIGGPDGVTMTDGAPPVDESALWIAVSGNSQVVKVNTRGTPAAPNPYIAGRFPSIVPYCTHTAFSFGFNARTNATSGAVNITNWALGGVGIDPAEVPVPIPLGERYRTVRNGSANIVGSTLQLVNGADQNGSAWYRLPQAAYNGFDTAFNFQSTTSGVEGFAFSVQNDGNSSWVTANAEDGYKSDLSISFDRIANDGAGTNGPMVEVFFWGASLGRFSSPPLSTTTLHSARIYYNVSAPFPGAGTGTLSVWVDGGLVVNALPLNIVAKLLSPSNTGDSCVAYWGTSPSRTTLDANSDAFVGNRSPQGTVTKYAGTSEAARCTRDVNNNGFQLADTSISTTLGPGTNGWNDECIQYTAPVGGNSTYNGRASYVRAVTISANDTDSGPAGSIWVGSACGLNCGSAYNDWHASKLRNRDGYELAYFGIGVNPYGAAISGDGRVWYTTGHNGTSNTYVDGASFNDSTSGGVGCEGQACVGPVFTLPAEGSANLTIKNGAYCNSVFYGMTVDEWSNVWNAIPGCYSVARLTPPGYQRVDQAPGVLAGAGGHWDFYHLENYPVGVFVTKAKPAVLDDPLTTTVNEFVAARPALAFMGADTMITQLDPISMSPLTRVLYTGTLSGHGGLSFDADDYLWRVGGSYVSRIRPYAAPPAPAENAAFGSTKAVTTRFNLDVGGSTYTYSDFTGYTRANIAGRQASLPRYFMSTCGDNARKKWTRLKWTGSVPNHTQMEFRVMTANTVLDAQIKIAGGIPDAGPFYYTPDIVPTGSTAPANTNESGVWLPLELPLAAQTSEYIAIQATFSADDFTSSPQLTGIEIEGTCEGLALPACTLGAPTCATGNNGPFNCGVIDNGCGGTITCGGPCPVGMSCGGSEDPNTVPNNVCGTGIAGSVCGDGVMSGNEACDDGNSVTEISCAYGVATCQKCNALCTAALNLQGGTCGDWATNGPETCDDGNQVTEVACPYGSATCTLCNATCTTLLPLVGPACGDGAVNNVGELCDDGNQITETFCPTYGSGTCVRCNAFCDAELNLVGPKCGDGVINGPEICDDGNIVNEAACPGGVPSCSMCNATCTAPINFGLGVCGDGVTNGTELCDDGNLVTETSCPYNTATCTKCNAACSAVLNLTGMRCGDGVVNGPEVCDDRNASACGTCSSTCAVIQTLTAATGSLKGISSGLILDGESFTLDDGINPPLQFEFDKGAPAGVTAGRIAIVLAGGDTANNVATKMRDAINAVLLNLRITATKAGSTVNLVNDNSGAFGNVAIQETVVEGTFIFTGMSGGKGRDCPINVGCNSNNDCALQGAPVCNLGTKLCGP